MTNIQNFFWTELSFNYRVLGIRQIDSIIVDIRYPTAMPIMPKNCPKITIVKMKVPKEMILLKSIRLLFSCPNNFDVKIFVIVTGMILKLRILITSTVSKYAGKNIGIIIGVISAPRKAIITETRIVILFNFLFSSPCASYGTVYLKTMTVNIKPTVTSCMAKEKLPRAPNPKRGTMMNLFRWEFSLVKISIT